MAVTLIADYGLSNSAWLPSGAVVTLLADFGVTPGGARTAISRLARRGVLESQRRGRHTSYRLTWAAANALAAGGTEIASFPHRAESWDGRWTLIAFSLPQQGDTQRRALRARLRWLGYAPLYDALWVSPHSSAEEASAALVSVSVGSVTVFQAYRIDLDRTTGRDPLSAWNLATVEGRYTSFIDRWSPLLPRIRSGEVRGAESLRARTGVMDSYRRFVALDPRLPTRLMPVGWPRKQARETFVAVYDGLAEAALGYVRSTVARFADGPQPLITTHTVDDLVGSLLPRPSRAQGLVAGR